MHYTPGNQVWVKCADGEWWPAKVQPLPESFSAFVTNSSEDCCVTFYHDPEQLYPICSLDATQVKPFHAEESERTLLEQQLFSNASVQTAVRRALADGQIVPHASPLLNSSNINNVADSQHRNENHRQKNSNNSNVKRILSREDKANIIANIKANATRQGADDTISTVTSNTSKKSKAKTRRKVKSNDLSNAVNNDQESITAASPSTTTTTVGINGSSNRVSALPYSVSELRNIQSLLNAVGRNTANQLRSSLEEAGVQLNHSIVRRKQAHELAERKRFRAKQNDAIAAFTSQSSSQDSLHSSLHREQHVSRGTLRSNKNKKNSNCMANELPESSLPSMDMDEEQFSMQQPRSSLSATSTAIPFEYCTEEEEEEEEEESELEQHQEPLHRSENGVLSSYQFTPCVSRSVLNVLRQEVFENAHRFVLSPNYRFREVLGAVHVDNNNVFTTLPSPHALWELPAGGFDTHRRVLLVPLTEEYEHTAGWLVPMEIDEQWLTMELFVNGLQIAVPENWHLSAGKARSAVKTAITLDITSLVLQKSTPRSSNAVTGKYSCNATMDSNYTNTQSKHEEMRNKRSKFEFGVAPHTDDALMRESKNRRSSSSSSNNDHDLLSLAVGFSHLIPDTELWSGIIACIFVDERSIDDVAQDILCNYRAAGTHCTFSSHGATHFLAATTNTNSINYNNYNNNINSNNSRININNQGVSVPSTKSNHENKSITGTENVDKEAMIDVTEAYVKIQCPLTTLQMCVPVRSVHCEHLQCMELKTVLLRCVQSNLWNCPLCDAPMRPNEMVINYRLQEWIKKHTHELQQVDYVIETPSGQPLRIVYHHKQSRNVVSIDVNDETCD